MTSDSNNPTRPLLRSGRDLEISCTAVGNDGIELELTHFKQRTKPVAQRLMKLYQLKCASEEDEATEANTENTQKKLSCCDRLRHPCDKQILSPRLQRIRDKGSEMIRSIVFPVLSRWNQKLSMLLLLLSVVLSFISLAFAIATAVHQPHNVLVPVRITVTVCTIALSVAHLIINYVQNKKSSSSKGVKNNDDSGNDQVSSLQKITRKLCSLPTLELYCILLKEVFEYPVVVCNIIEKATTLGLSTYKEKLLFAYFIYSILKLAFEVYFIRFIVLCSSIHSLRQLRKGNVLPDTGETNRDINEDTEMTQVQYDLYTTHGLLLEIFFCCHVLLQMICQVFLLAALWVKIECENPYFDENQELYVSSYSWILIFGGFFMPILGTFAFYIPWNKHIQMYPIEFMIDMLNALRKCGITSISQNAMENLKRIHKSIITAMGEDKKSLTKALCTILTTPTLTILSLLFLFPFLITTAGIIGGPIVEYENGTVFCDLSISLKINNTNYTNSTDEYYTDVTGHASLWSGINIAALIIIIFSNGAILGISLPSLFCVAIGIILLVPLLPPLFIISVLTYFMCKQLSPKEEWNILTCLCICIAALYHTCDDMFLK